MRFRRQIIIALLVISAFTAGVIVAGGNSILKTSVTTSSLVNTNTSEVNANIAVTNTVANASPTSNTASNVSTTVTAKCVFNAGLPDPSCTPGEISPAVTQANIASTICVSGYTKTVRPSTSITGKIKEERMVAYGYFDSPNNYELDHLIPLELGGAPSSVKNLFPEPYAGDFGATKKDTLENKLKSLVCSGAVALGVAQNAIATNWITAYDTYVLSNSATVTNTVVAPLNTNTAVITNTTSAVSNSNDTQVIKKSTSGICHAPGTTYYGRTLNFTPFNTLQACLDSGGRLPLK